MFFYEFFGSGKSQPEITIFNCVGGQLKKTRLVWEGSAGDAVCRGGERGGVKLPQFEDFAGEHSVKHAAPMVAADMVLLVFYPDAPCGAHTAAS